MREWASLGVKRGARSRGLRLGSGGASKRDEGGGCWWWPPPPCEWRGAKRRAPAPAPPALPPPAVAANAVAPPLAAAPPAWGSSPTSWAVRGGGRKLSKMGLRMRPSLAYLAEEKYWRSGWDSEVQRKVGSLRMDLLRLSDRPDRPGGPDRNGGCEVQGEGASAPPDDDAAWGSSGGARRGGGGGEEEDEAVDEACWELTSAAADEDEDMRTPVGGLMIGFLPPAASRDLWVRPSRLTGAARRPRTHSSSSGSEGGEGGGRAPCRCSSASCGGGAGGGECSSSSDWACVASEACESQDESSRLGLLEREDSAEDSWDECCDSALEPQEAALLLNRPLVALLAPLLSRAAAAAATVAAAAAWALGDGAGGGGGGSGSG